MSHILTHYMVYNYKRKVPIVGMGTAEDKNETHNIDETWATRESGFMKW